MIITIFISTIFLCSGCIPNLLMILVLIILLIILMWHNIILIMITYYTDIAAWDWLQYIELPDYGPVNPDLPINTTVCTVGHSSQVELQTLPNWDRDNCNCPTEVSWPNEVSRMLRSDFTYLRRHVGLHPFFLSSDIPHRSPCTIRSWVFPVYDTISRLSPVRYDLTSLSCTISISEPPLLRYLVLGECRSLST